MHADAVVLLLPPGADEYDDVDSAAVAAEYRACAAEIGAAGFAAVVRQPPSTPPTWSAPSAPSVRDEVLGVDDRVRVTLLGEEPLAVRGELLVDGVPRDHGVEVRRPPVRLGPQDPAEPLGLLLP